MPFDVFFNSFKIGNIYKFIYPSVHSTILHYFVLIGYSTNENDTDLIFGCCTSQFNKRVKYLELNNLPLCTLVPIAPNSTNNLTHPDNCIDCNFPIHISKIKLEEVFNNSGNYIPFIGEFSDSDLDQLFIGIHSSDLVEEWIKEIVPESLDDIPQDLRIF